MVTPHCVVNIDILRTCSFIYKLSMGIAPMYLCTQISHSRLLSWACNYSSQIMFSIHICTRYMIYLVLLGGISHAEAVPITYHGQFTYD